jgi:murein DD-endopeptidase MepM/ murein hydrolase activator NlpD
VTWLYQQVSYLWSSLNNAWTKLNNLIGQIASGIAYAASLARSAADAAADWAIAVVKAWAASVFVTAVMVWYIVEPRVREVVDAAVSTLLYPIAQGVAVVRAMVLDQVAQIATQIQNIRALVDVAKATTVTLVTTQVVTHDQEIKSWVTTNFPQIADIFGTDDWKNLQALGKFIGSILLWFSDPLRAIRELVMGWLITWVCRALAHEIDDSVSLYDTSVSSSGYGGGELPVGVSPQAAGELAWPLDSLVICGYTFNAPPGHMGVDLALPAGRRVYAMTDGAVSVPPYMPSGYGHYCIVQDGAWRTLYAHAETVQVDDGVKVKQGQQVMLGNSTGRSTGNHLHLEIKYNGQYIDPMSVLPIAGKRWSG